jgi:pimeloyl-ACP methyl ester carboxylesterase
MPIAKTENLSIYYEMIGQGEPLVMIRGVGSNVDHGYEQVPVLSKKYQLLVFDNRGIARSSDPGGCLFAKQTFESSCKIKNCLSLGEQPGIGFGKTP